MGRSAKPPERRQRRNRRPLQLVKKGDLAIHERPAPPKGVLRATSAEWKALWDRPVSAAIMPEHLPALERLFLLKDERRRAYRAIRESTEDGGRLSLGSQGQAVLNPLIRYIAELDGEIRQLEDRFGLTPRAGYSLGARYGEAVASLQDLSVGDPHADEDPFHSDLYGDEGTPKK